MEYFYAIEHTKQFNILVLNCVTRKVYLMVHIIRAFSVLDAFTNIYIHGTYNLSCEQYFMFIYLLLERFRTLNKLLRFIEFIDIIYSVIGILYFARSLHTSDNNNSTTLVKLNDNDTKNIIKKVSVLYGKLFDIMNLINYTFGIQSMIITVMVIIYGILSIFTSFLVMIDIEPGLISNARYMVFFSVYYHFHMLSICFIDSLISTEVI